MLNILGVGKYYQVIGIGFLTVITGWFFYDKEHETHNNNAIADNPASVRKIVPENEELTRRQEQPVNQEVIRTESTPYRKPISEKEFSDNVYAVRDQLSQGIEPEVEDIISAYREIYANHPDSFKRNIEKEFKEVLNPTPYCNTTRSDWAQPYISEVNAGFVFVDEERWQQNSVGNRVQLAQYLSKCTQDGAEVEILSSASGVTIAYYSVKSGYQISGY